MAKTITASRTAGKAPKGKMVIQQIDIRQIQRTTQDIEKWRQAIQTAENIQFPRKIKLFDLYSDILLDAHLSSVIDKRKIAVLKSPITFTKDGKENEVICELIKSPSFVKMLDSLLDCRFWGHTLIEFEFNQNSIIPHLIPRKHVVPEKGLILINQNDQDGILYREAPYNNMMLEAGEPGDLGLLVKAAQYVIYKRNCLGDYSQYSELFGQPLRKGTYNPYDENSRTQLKSSMEEAGSSSWCIFPEGTNIEFVESTSKTGSSDLYSKLIELCNAEISKLIVGQTLTTEAGDKGARALGEVHKEVEDEIEFADKLFIKHALNFGFRDLLLKHGYPADGEFDFTEDEAMSLTARIAVDSQLNNIIPISDDYYYETYGIPKPDNYDELKKKKDEEKAAANNPFSIPANQDPGKNSKQPQNRLSFWDQLFFHGARE